MKLHRTQKCDRKGCGAELRPAAEPSVFALRLVGTPLGNGSTVLSRSEEASIAALRSVRKPPEVRYTRNWKAFFCQA
jgi:hypothetical protein